MGLYILLYSPYFFACYAGRCVPCLSLGGYLLLLVAVVPPDGEDFDDGDYFVLVDEVDQAVLVADVP